MSTAPFKWPNGAPKPGEAYPQNGYADFDGADFEGKKLGSPNRRMQWVLCPFGTGRTVAKIWVEAGDDSDDWGGCRSEQWQNPRDVGEGDETWCAFENAIPVGFKTGSWNVTGVQQHVGHASPQFGVEIQPDDTWGIAVRTPCSAANTDPRRVSMGHRTQGRYVLHLIHTKWTVTSNGLTEYYFGIGAPPDVTKAPAFSYKGQTLDETTKVAQVPNLTTYRNPAGGGFPTIQYVAGVGRASTAAEAMKLAGFGGGVVVPPVPVPPTHEIDIDAAIAENIQTLDWMIRSKKTGGCGYTVERTKLTHAYKELLILGGTWH